jgi:hypothetical protein
MTPQQRQSAFLILGAQTFLPLLLVFVAFSTTGNGRAPREAIPMPIAYVIGASSLLGALVYGGKNLIAGVTPARFNQQMIITLALSEFSALIGFVSGLGDWARVVPFAAGTIAVNLLFVAPRVSAFYR